MNEPVPKKVAAAYMNEDFICLKTYSGYRMVTADPEGKMYRLPVSVSDQELGERLAEALAASRNISKENIRAYYDREKETQRYEDWVALLLEKYGYRSRQALFKNMKSCDVRSRKGEGTIQIKPSIHDQLEGWSGNQYTSENKVVISDQCPPAELGAALRLAFERCV